jgi:hypothetical protein
MSREDAVDRDLIGVDHIMWGSDFPHEEGTFPHSREALAHTYAGMDPTEVARMVGGNAADVYGFDLHELAKLASRLGPEVDMVRAGINDIPETSSLAFGPRLASVS